MPSTRLGKLKFNARATMKLENNHSDSEYYSTHIEQMLFLVGSREESIPPAFRYAREPCQSS
jgi:hypothetical protein